jgi:hypothetical protein
MMSLAPSDRLHAPFALANRLVNPLFDWLLRSRAHWLLSRWLCLITVTGKKTGHRHTLPVGYREDNGVLNISLVLPDRKRWWRNLRTEAPVELILRGVRRTGRGLAIEDDDGVSVTVSLDRRPISSKT